MKRLYKLILLAGLLLAAVSLPRAQAQTAKITVSATQTDSYFAASATVTVKVSKAKNPITLAKKTATIKYAKLKKAKRTVTINKAKKAQGTVTYKKVSGNKNITIAKNGKLAVKKGLKKGPYKVKVRLTAAGNANYESKSVAVTATITVK